MLRFNELKDYGGFNNPYQIEKDYLQHIILISLSEITGNEIVFKGGTALQKIYGLPRFSSDLDFSTNLKKHELNNFLQKAIKKIQTINRDFGYEAEVSEPTTNKYNTIEFHARIKGPSYIARHKQSQIQDIRIDIPTYEKPVHEKLVSIRPRYADLREYVLNVMELREILAEKCRAIMDRKSATDLFDIYHILTKDVKFSAQLITKKLNNENKQFKKTELVNNIKEISEKEWKSINPIILLKQMPSLKEVKKNIITQINNDITVV